MSTEGKTRTTAASNGRPEVVITSAADYSIGDIDYIEGYEGMIPKATLSLLAGDSGLGKSQLAALISAREAQLGHTTVLCAAEDGVANTIKPRLLAAGLLPDQLELVRFIKLRLHEQEYQLRLPDDEVLLREGLERLHAEGCPPTWMNLDPVVSFLGHEIENASDQSIREALGPLIPLAEQFQVAITVTAHFNKKPYTTVMERLANSNAFYQLPRSIIVFGRDPDDPETDRGSMRVLVSEKLTDGAKPLGHHYRVTSMSVEAPETRTGFRDTSCLVRGMSPSYKTPQDLLIAARRKPEEKRRNRASEKTDAACALLIELLGPGPMLKENVITAAEDLGISMSTLDNARKRLGVKTRRTHEVPARTEWYLPEDEDG